MAFKDNQLQGPNLRECLFGLDFAPTLMSEGIPYLDREIAANPPFIAHESLQNKRMRLADGWGPWGPAQQHFGGTLSNIALSSINYQNFAPLSNPYCFNVPAGLNPMAGIPYVGHWNLQHAQPHHIQNQEHTPFYLHRTG